MKLIPKYQEGNRMDAIANYKPQLFPRVERVVNGTKWSSLTFKERLRNLKGFRNGRPTEKGLEIVSPEFDILTGIRGLANLSKGFPKGFLKGTGNNLMKRDMKNVKRTLTNEERLGIPRGDRKSPSPYKQVGTAVEPKSRMEDLTVDSPIFGDYINRGRSQFVFNNSNNPNEVLKVYTGRNFKSPSEIKEFHRQWMKRNKLPLQERINFKGYLQGDNRIYPIYSQNKIQPLPDMPQVRFQKEYVPQIDKLMNDLGYEGSGTYTNGKLTVGDVAPYNMGYDSKGNLRFFDADIYKRGGRLLERA